MLRAHGQEPTYRRKGNNSLDAESRRKYAEIDLRFHDLRHEASSRFIEAGWPVHHVQEMLDHANMKTTSTYLNVTAEGLVESMRKFGTLQTLAKKPAREPRPLRKAKTPHPARVSVN